MLFIIAHILGNSTGVKCIYCMIAAVDTAGCAEEQILNCNQTDADDGVGCENDDEEPVAMIEESRSGITTFFSSQVVVFFRCSNLSFLQKSIQIYRISVHS